MEKSERDGDGRGMLLTLYRGIRVIEEIARQEGTATAKTLSANVGLNVATCYQILRTLHVNGYVNRLPGSRYGLGPRIAFLIDHYQSLSAPPPQLIEILRDLHGRLGESVYCSLRQGSKLQIAAYLEGTKAVRVAPMHVGYSDHPHARASGKCFLAFADPRELDAFVDKENLERVTENTITDWGEFLQELEVIRRRGFALDNQEFNDGVACVATALLGKDARAMGAFAVALPVDRLHERQGDIVALAMEAGSRGSEILGYEGEYPPRF
jgi:IclR family transcriptional regulator, acetate operon repressor